MWALEQKTFWPLRTKPPSTAVDRADMRAPTSEPAWGAGHRDRLDRAAGDAAEDLGLLLLAAEALGRAGDDQGRRVAADRRQPARGLLHEQAGLEHRAAGAAVLLGDRHPEPAELRHLPVDVEVVVLAVAVGQPLALVLRAHSRAQKSRIASTKSLCSSERAKSTGGSLYMCAAGWPSPGKVVGVGVPGVSS